MTMSESTPEDRQQQRTDLTGDTPQPEPPEVPLEADAGDAAEQAVAVEVDEDERR